MKNAVLILSLVSGCCSIAAAILVISAKSKKVF